MPLYGHVSLTMQGEEEKKTDHMRVYFNASISKSSVIPKQFFINLP